MKRKLMVTVVLLLAATVQNMYCQTLIIRDSLQIEFKKAKQISNSYLHSSAKMKKSDHHIRIMVRCDLKALYKQPVDINAFSLVDTENKFRYRIATYFGYKKGPSLFSHGDLGRTHLKKEVLNKRGKQYKFLPPYDPSVADSFKENDFEGYTNIEVPVRYYNMVSGEVISVIYYSPSQKPNFRADMQFVLITNQKTPVLKLYYGKELITDVELDN